MGAEFDELDLDGNLTTSQVGAKFKAYQNECSHESGNSYSGRLNMCHGLKFATHKVFESRNEAYEYLNDTCQKWDDAIAVQYLASNPINRDDAKASKLRDAVRLSRETLQRFESALTESVESKLKSVEFIKCNGCKSRLDTRFRRKTLKCPVCESSFASKTELKKRESLKSKVESAETKLREYLQKMQAKANTKNRAKRWLIGGVCSS